MIRRWALAAHRGCPRCGGSIRRVPRYFIDQLISYFVPVHRYSCSTYGCQWEGLLRRPDDSQRRLYFLGAARSAPPEPPARRASDER